MRQSLRVFLPGLIATFGHELFRKTPTFKSSKGIEKSGLDDLPFLDDELSILNASEKRITQLNAERATYLNGYNDLSLGTNSQVGI